MTTRWLLAALLAALVPGAGACSDDEGGGGGGGDGDADADGDGDGDGDGDACSLDCELDRQLPYDQQAALPTCEDNDAWSRDPEILNVQQDAEGRVIHWEVTLRYQNNHQFVVRYDVESFCPDDTMESLSVEAESFDPMGTWTCESVFFCL